ncbi:hypothetical protein BaRGS_00036066, partial [Batillaria attramentaria]
SADVGRRCPPGGGDGRVAAGGGLGPGQTGVVIGVSQLGQLRPDPHLEISPVSRGTRPRGEMGSALTLHEPGSLAARADRPHGKLHVACRTVESNGAANLIQFACRLMATFPTSLLQLMHFPPLSSAASAVMATCHQGAPETMADLHADCEIWGPPDEPREPFRSPFLHVGNKQRRTLTLCTSLVDLLSFVLPRAEAFCGQLRRRERRFGGIAYCMLRCNL